MKLVVIRETEGGFDAGEPVDTSEKYFAVRKAAKAAERQYYLAREQLDKFSKHAEISWNGKWKTPVSHQAKFGFTYWGMPASTPNGDSLWRTIEHYGKRVTRAQKLMGRFQRLATKLKQQYRTETFDELKAVPKETIPSTKVPRRIHYTKDNYFNNPYWIRDNVVTRYAGPVGHFPKFSTAERSTLAELERTLRRYHIPGFTTLYGVTIQPDRRTSRTDNRFVAIGADGRVIWKRIGGNVIYVDGKKVSIAYMTDTHNHEALEMQKRILEPLKGTKP